jgi:hypothetical protein
MCKSLILLVELDSQLLRSPGIIMFLEGDPRDIPNKDRERSQDCGGCDDDFNLFNQQDTTPYFDKGDHKERSRYNQPNHEDHWKKEEHKVH